MESGRLLPSSSKQPAGIINLGSCTSGDVSRDREVEFESRDPRVETFEFVYLGSAVVAMWRGSGMMVSMLFLTNDQR